MSEKVQFENITQLFVQIPSNEQRDNFYRNFLHSQTSVRQVHARELTGGASGAKVHEVSTNDQKLLGVVLKSVRSDGIKQLIECYKEIINTVNTNPKIREHLVIPYKYYVDGNEVHMWMPRMEHTLEQLTDPLSIEMRIDACRQIAEVLDEMHKVGMMHQDVKPNNIMKRTDKGGFANWSLVDLDRIIVLSPSLPLNIKIVGTYYELIDFLKTIKVTFKENVCVGEWCTQKSIELSRLITEAETTNYSKCLSYKPTCCDLFNTALVLIRGSLREQT